MSPRATGRTSRRTSPSHLPRPCLPLQPRLEPARSPAFHACRALTRAARASVRRRRARRRRTPSPRAPTLAHGRRRAPPRRPQARRLAGPRRGVLAGWHRPHDCSRSTMTVAAPSSRSSGSERTSTRSASLEQDDTRRPPLASTVRGPAISRVIVGKSEAAITTHRHVHGVRRPRLATAPEVSRCVSAT